MPPVAVAANLRRLTLNWAAHHRRAAVGIAIIHLVALVSMVWTEVGPLAMALYLLTWAILNCVFLLLLRRPGIAAALSLILFQITITLSQFKFATLWMTINALDVMIIDADTFAFLLGVLPSLRTTLIVAALIAVPLLALIWRLDPFRVRPAAAASVGVSCLAVLSGLSILIPEEPWEQFQGVNHISNFARSGVLSVSSLSEQGWFQADQAAADHLKAGAVGAGGDTCQTAKRPHIILLLDESSYDIRTAPGIKVPPGYGSHFQSFDGRQRSLVVEGAGGPTWYTEYNVLTGLSARNYGRLMFYVTRIAAGRVERGLPQALRRCGYKTFSLYPAYGAFLGARGFQRGAGVEHFIDQGGLGMGDVEPDSFFFDKAAGVIERERGSAPLFLFLYTVANHFPWDKIYRPDLSPGWQPLGNGAEPDEYIRRQTVSARDYAAFVGELKRKFPGDSFLIVRFGDHQPPTVASRLVDPSASEADIARRVMGMDPRYFTTYYAIDAINFRPVDVSSALDTIEAPYLPLVVQEAAGLPLDPSFAEQKNIMMRCHGLFYRCANGAEARRFNRLLIDAGLIKGM
jgi:hypothetical protein